jgi:hypothetical protein
MRAIASATVSVSNRGEPSAGGSSVEQALS